MYVCALVVFFILFFIHFFAHCLYFIFTFTFAICFYFLLFFFVCLMVIWINFRIWWFILRAYFHRRQYAVVFMWGAKSNCVWYIWCKNFRLFCRTTRAIFFIVCVFWSWLIGVFVNFENCLKSQPNRCAFDVFFLLVFYGSLFCILYIYMFLIFYGSICIVYLIKGSEFWHWRFQVFLHIVFNIFKMVDILFLRNWIKNIFFKSKLS